MPRRRRILAGSVRLGCALVVAIVVCTPLVARAQPAAGGGLVKDLQHDLAALASAASAARAGGSPSVVSSARQLLERIRATDLLIQEQQRSIDERLQRTKASAAPLQRQQDHTRLFRERMDRLYRASEPLTSDTPATEAQARAAFAAIVESLRDAVDTESRTPIGAILPYRSLAWPQVAPQPGAAITPAYLTTPVPAPQAADLAETTDTLLSDAIRTRAAALSRDSIAIFEFVSNSVRSEFYYGAMKDASDTLRQLSGNDTDQATLLVALLRASQVPARYVRGVVRLTGAQAVQWTGAGSTRRAAEIFTRAGIPFRPILQGGSIGAFEIEHTWVEAYVPYSNYRGVRLGTIGRAWIPLDPSFKAVDVTAGEDVLAAMGFNAGTTIASYLSQTQPLAPVDFYRSAITTYLTQTGSPLTFDDVLSTRGTRAMQTGLLPSTLPYSVVSIHGESPELPDALRHRVRFVAEGEGGRSFDVTIPAAELAGRRLTLSYIPATVEDQAVAHSFLGLDNTPAYLVKLRPVLKVGGVVKAAGSTPVQMGGFHSFTVEIQTPRGAVPVVNSMLAGGYYALGLATQPAAYEIPLARPPDDTEHPAADRLYAIAIDYIRRWNDAEQTLERLLRVVNVRPALSVAIVGTVHARTVVFGQPQAIEWRGVFVDADLRVAEPVPTGADDARAQAFMRLSGLAGAVLEADVLQSNLNVDAISAASVIQLAREGALVVEEVTAANLADVLARLQTADIVKSDIADAVNQGWRVTIPQRDLTRRIWSGIGYVMIDPATGAGGYFISGGLAGGISTDPPADWPDQPIANELANPNAEPPNTDPTSALYLTKVAVSDKQKGTVDQVLTRPLRVWARDADGRAVAGASVTFYVQAGGGTFSGDADTITVATNDEGVAETSFKLGRSTAAFPHFVKVNPGDAHVTQVGQNLVTASVTTDDGELFLAAPFEEFGYPGPPAEIVKVLGDNPQIVGNLEPTIFSGSVVARIEDAFDNPIANASVVFRVLAAQPAHPAAPTLPVGALNMKIYPLEPPCAIPTPVLNDCNGVEQVTTTSLTDAVAVNTIAGDTAGTIYRVEVSLPGFPDVASQTFRLVTRTLRTFTDLYFAPQLLIVVPHVVGEFGQPLNATAVSTQLSQPLEALLMLREDTYLMEAFTTDCDGPDESCVRVRSTGRSRVRPIDVHAQTGAVLYNQLNTVVTRPRADETATVTFMPGPNGIATTTPTVNTGAGRYSSRVSVGALPMLHEINVTATATVWAPCFNLKTGTVTPMLVTLRAGQNVAADSMYFPLSDASDFESCGETGALQVSGAEVTGRHLVFGVRATTTPTRIAINNNGVAQGTSSIPYTIEPNQYVASIADLDLFATERDGSETWLGYLPTSIPFGQGNSLVVQGSRFDPALAYHAQLVLNRGTPIEIRSDKALLTLQKPALLTFDSSRAIPVITVMNRTAQTICPAPGTISFGLSREASVSITIDGHPFTTSDASGTTTWTNVMLDGGEHHLPVLPDAVPLPGTHAVVIAATFATPDQPDIVATASGVVLHNVSVNAFLPVGHTLVAGVDVFDGHFTLARDDISLAGHGPKLEFTRTYSTSGHDSSGVMGAGWSHNWDARVTEACGVITLIGSQGSGVRFDAPVLGTDGQGNAIATYRPQPGHHGRLVKQLASGAFDFYTVQGVRYHYEPTPDPASGRATRLAFVEDTNRNRLTLTYEALPPFNLSTVTDASGRTLAFTYQRFGFTQDIRLTGIAGPLDLAVVFDYDIYGNLIRAARGPQTERYEYALDNPRDLHNLIRIIGPNNGVTGASSDVMRIQYFTDADPIPGESPNALLFPEKYEIVKTVTSGDGSPVAASHNFAYDYSNRATRMVSAVIDPRQTTTIYTMHPHFGAVVEQRVLTEAGPNVTTTRWAFQDGINDVQITSVTDALGRRTSYTYDANGNVATATIHADTAPYAAVTDSAGAVVSEVVTQTDFDPVLGRLTRQVEPGQRITEHQIDAGNGNVLSTTTYPGGGLPPLVTRYGYGSRNGLHGLLTSVTDPRDHVTTYTEFDALGNAITSIGPEGTTTTNRYDARGRLRETRDTTGRRIEYEYDELDRVSAVTRSTWAPPADLRVTTTEFFPGGQVRRVTDGNGHVTEFEYDARNQQVTQRDVVQNAAGQPETLLISRSYDGNGNKVTEIDRRGLRHVFVYDALNRPTEVLVQNQQILTNAYDAAGNAIGETDLHGHATQVVFDALYRPIRRVLPLAPYFTAKTYDLTGNVLRETDENGQSTTMAYDGMNRLTQITNAVGVTKQFDYDASGNRRRERNLSTGLQIETTHDGADRPETVTQTFVDPLSQSGVSYRTTFAYNDVEHTTTTTSPLGVITVDRYNGHDELVEHIEDPDGVNLRMSYQYDGNGNLVVETDAEGGAPDKTYSYDGLNRRISATYPLGGQDLWFFDGNDNVVRTVDGRGIVRRFEYDHLDRKVREILVESLSNAGSELATLRLDINDASNSATATDANNNSTLQEFDALHRTVRTVDAMGQQERAEWDGVNQRARINKRGFRTEMTYDGLNRVIERSRAFETGVHLERARYVEATNQRIDTDANGVETTTQFDPLQRTRRVSRRHSSLAARYGAPEVVVEEHEYDAHGNVTRSTDGNGNVTAFAYDGGDRRFRVTAGVGSPIEAVTTFVFDRADNLLRVKDARPHEREFDVRYTYDLRNRKVLEENAARETRTFDYDQNDNLVRVVEPKGQAFRTTFDYDEMNQLIFVDETRGGAGGVTRYLHDANRNRIAHQDATGSLVTWRYDALNRPTDAFAHTVPGNMGAGHTRAQGAGGNEATARHSHFAFDSAGNQTLIVDAEGQRVVKTYDGLDRITGKQYSQHRNAADGGPILPRVTGIDYRYDLAGNQTQVEEHKIFESGPATETTLTDYDALNRVIRRTNPDGKSVAFEYDRAGNQTAVIDADNVRTNYTFDARNQMATAAVGAAATAYTYWPDGLQRSITHPNGVTSQLEYDAADRTRSMLNHGGDPSSPISRFDYTYDANGNRVSALERHSRLNGGSAQESSFRYDTLNRLTEVDYPGAAAISYTYARNGNRVGENGIAPDGTTPVARTYAYDHLNQLTSIVNAANPAASESRTYDRNGNTLERRVGLLDENGDVPAPTSVTRYDWEIRDFLARTNASIGEMVYDYDYAGRRVKSISPVSHTRYLYDLADVTQEYDGASFLTTLRFSYGPGGPFSFATAGASSQRFYFVTDMLGSTSEVTDGAGATQASYSYDPWGQIVVSFDTTPNRRRFTGHYQDSETGLQYFGARYYDSSLGRFLTRDLKPGEPAAPISQNPFLFAHANPLTFRDLDGHTAASCSPNVFLSCTRRAVLDKLNVAKDRAWENSKALAKGIVYEPIAHGRDLLAVTFATANTLITGYTYTEEQMGWWSSTGRGVQQAWNAGEKDSWKLANDAAGVHLEGLVLGKVDPFIKAGGVLLAVASGDGTRVTESLVDLAFSVGSTVKMGSMKKLTRELLPVSTANAKVQKAFMNVNKKTGYVSAVRDASPLTALGARMMASLIPKQIQAKPLGIKAKSWLAGFGIGYNKDTKRYEAFRSDNDMLSVWDPSKLNDDGTRGRFLSNDEVASDYIPKLQKEFDRMGLNREVQHPTQLSASKRIGGTEDDAHYGKIGHPGPVTVFGNDGVTKSKLSSSQVRGFAILNDRPWHRDWDATPPWRPDLSKYRHAPVWGIALNSMDDEDKRKRLYAK